MIGRPAIALVALFAIAAGCDKGSCKKRLATFQERLEKAVAWDSGPALAPVELVEAARGRPLEPGRSLTIAVLHDGVTINGRPVPKDVDDLGLREMLALEREAHRLTGGGAPLVIDLWIDRRAPIAEVRRIVEVLGPGEVRLIARLPGELDIPAAPERVTESLAAIDQSDPSERATAFARLIEGAIGGCEAAGEVFGAMATVAPDQRSGVLEKKLVPALARCGCAKVDVPLLEEALLRLFGAREPRRGWVPLDRARLESAPNVAGLYP